MSSQIADRTERRWPAGAAIEAGASAILILEGRVQISIAGRPVTTVGAGELIGAPFTTVAEPLTTIALTDVNALELNQEAWVAVMHHPAVATAILRVLADSHHFPDATMAGK